jgi:hypothetical protein
MTSHTDSAIAASDTTSALLESYVQASAEVTNSEHNQMSRIELMMGEILAGIGGLDSRMATMEAVIASVKSELMSVKTGVTKINTCQCPQSSKGS